MKYKPALKKLGAMLPFSMAGAAMAAPVTITTTDVEAQITAGSTAIMAVGMAVLAICAIIFTVRIIRRAF